ncbi:hypothetical protein CWB63_18645, partial [Pseudoalteromonas sp. S409]
FLQEYQFNHQPAHQRASANKTAFRKTMVFDIAIGGSSNTVLHLLASAQEDVVDFDISHIDELSRKTPFLFKVAPATAQYPIEDWNRDWWRSGY